MIVITYLRTSLRLKLDDRAVTAIEYALIAALVAIVIVSGVTNLGKNLTNTFTRVGSEL